MSSHFKNNSGFSIIELTISIGIVLTIMAVVLSNQATYTDGIALSTLADEISITIAQAQTYGSGVRELSPGNFSAAYGLSFAVSSSKTYIYFADQDGDKIYDVGESLSQIDISRGNYISRICAVKSLGPEDCDIERVDITFTRPKTEPQLIFPKLIDNLIGARIELKSPAGTMRSVTVYSTGQITVQ